MLGAIIAAQVEAHWLMQTYTTVGKGPGNGEDQEGDQDGKTNAEAE